MASFSFSAHDDHPEPQTRAVHAGLGAARVEAFEAHAMRRGCTSCCLETVSFQVPPLHERPGYRAESVRGGFPYGIVEFHLVEQLAGGEAAA